MSDDVIELVARAIWPHIYPEDTWEHVDRECIEAAKAAIAALVQPISDWDGQASALFTDGKNHWFPSIEIDPELAKVASWCGHKSGRATHFIDLSVFQKGKDA